MAYDGTRPRDDDKLNVSAGLIRNNFEGLKTEIDALVIDTMNSLVLKADKTALDALTAQVIAQAFPVGTVFYFAAPTPPPGALVGDGSLVLITDFPELFEVVGYAHTPVGATPPQGYFYLPDYRDYFLRGHNPSGSREFGSEQQDALQNITGYIDMWVKGGSSATGALYAGTTNNGNPTSASSQGFVGLGFDVSRVARTATETRPVNKTVLICIKY